MGLETYGLGFMLGVMGTVQGLRFRVWTARLSVQGDFGHGLVGVTNAKDIATNTT